MSRKNRASAFKEKKKKFYVGMIHKKKTEAENRFGQSLHPDQIQNNVQNINGVDRFYQYTQSLHSPKPLPGSLSHSVTSFHSSACFDSVLF